MLDPLNEEDFRRIEKDRHELNAAYDNVRKNLFIYFSPNFMLLNFKIN